MEVDRKYKELMTLASDAIYIMDNDGNILEYNDHAQRLLGYSTQEMAKLNVRDWDPEISLEDYKQLVSTLSTFPVSFERRHKRKDGTHYEASISAVKIELGGSELKVETDESTGTYFSFEI
jgi:two-component system sensor histidine kinase/response regulator